VKTDSTKHNGKELPPLGHKRWVIPEGHLAPTRHGSEPDIASQETACVLNTSAEDAHLEITVFYSDAEPAGPYKITVPARRTKHIRFNDFRDPAPIPHATDFASVIESNVPIVVQHSRVDSRQPANALMTTIAFADTESLM
jgi:hypothetical protein